MAQLDKVIKARVTEEEKRALEMAAKMTHTTESDFVRKFVEFGVRQVLSQEMGKTIEGVSGLNKEFHMLTGIKPSQLMRILFFIGEVAAEAGKSDQFESILSLIFKDPSFGASIVDITQKYGVFNDVIEEYTEDTVDEEWAKHTKDKQHA